MDGIKMSRVKIIELFDFYGELLTGKQQKIIKDYYFMDFSLSEIADNLSISRQGVHAAINSSVKMLSDIEDKLKFHQKMQEIKQRILPMLENESTEDNIKKTLTEIVEEYL